MNGNFYIGEKKIKKHFEELKRVKVVFEDDSEASFTLKMFEISQSMEPLNETLLQERRILAFQADLMGLLLLWDMKLFDIQKMLNWSSNFLNDKHELADEKLWGNKFSDRTIGDLEKVLTDNRGGSGPTAS